MLAYGLVWDGIRIPLGRAVRDGADRVEEPRDRVPLRPRGVAPRRADASGGGGGGGGGGPGRAGGRRGGAPLAPPRGGAAPPRRGALGCTQRRRRSGGRRAPGWRLSWSLRELLLPGRQPIQRLERRQRVHVEPIELLEQRMRASRRVEQAELGRVRGDGRRLVRYVMTRFEQRKHLPRPTHHRRGKPREPPDMDTVGSVGAARLEAVPEDDLVSGFAHGH